MLLTRLTPQSLYYVDDGFLDKKLVIIEERYGSMEADYSIRVLQSRKKLIAAAPIKDPQTGNMRTRVFTVEARAAFIEATTASSVNHENATRCFELTMDESVEQTSRIHERQRLMRTEAGLGLRRKAEAIVKKALERSETLGASSRRDSFRHSTELPFELDENAARPCPVPQSHRGLGLSSPVPACEEKRSHRRHRGGLRSGLSSRQERDGHAFGSSKASVRNTYEHIRKLAQEDGGVVCRRRYPSSASTLPDSTVRRWLDELVELDYLEA